MAGRREEGSAGDEGLRDVHRRQWIGENGRTLFKNPNSCTML